MDALVIAGLGNPGPAYSSTRHNIGFDFVDALAGYHGADPWKSRFSGLISRCQASDGRPVFLIKPQTYMNRSGRCIAEVMAFYKLDGDHLIVVHDDLDLVPGQFRCKRGGGAGGHNGLKSLDSLFGRDYYRVRLGIGRPPAGAPVNPWVLGRMGLDDGVQVNQLLDRLVKHSDRLLMADLEGFANRVHSERDKSVSS